MWNIKPATDDAYLQDYDIMQSTSSMSVFWKDVIRVKPAKFGVVQ
jgi:hypothetical protein